MWHHFAGTYDGATMRVYLDGQEDNFQAQTGSIGTNNENINMAITTLEGCEPGILDGKLDDVRVYNRALSPAEVKQLYQLGTVIIRP